MDYPYENLDPERFQKLCQAILIKEHPNTQCFPVAQPDGGRDAVSYARTGGGFILFQVKFVRNPSTTNRREWLEEIIDKELPKIIEQSKRGAQQFVLITNLSGTAHPTVGTIDLSEKLLLQRLPIPSMTWWRDDLNRRLDGLFDLKWVYPELMTGTDLIRLALESALSNDRDRLISVLRSFIKAQFDADQEVKFKQVDLQNNLFDLFIDVPLTPTHGALPKKRQLQLQALQTHIAWDIDLQANEYPSPSDPYFIREDRPIGAATFLLHALAQEKIPRLVLEGAPGQGKSTITQYICQVHRIRLLGKSHLLEVLPQSHKGSPLRLPFRIDLRDLATWLSKRNPFLPESEISPPYWQKSLESFLAAQVGHQSGGTQFTVNDLLTVAKMSPLLIVFDGLDEVADIATRREVVEEIVGGLSRLEENTSSLQAIVTSRPAAFANSPGLPENRFPYYQLDSLTRSLIDEYAGKWIKARRLSGRDSAEVRRILREKLDQPHLKDLARNPMQLTILLSLIHTRGASLPDKRTSLYDNYVELFFSREAEKSSVVRDHRDLLINIHRFLAWTLHAWSEQGGSGSIKEEELQSLVSKFLISEGHDPNLLNVLFTGMVERVVALVSRVEGTYEFEVQPLREYFAARYLYETAPYSPPGDEKKGTKPERFDAIARNFYWLNVTRFYAGCYSKGELSSLIDNLQELIQEEDYNLISYPRTLAATLLSDWVFSQHPKSVREVIKLILDGIGLRYVLASSSRRAGPGQALVLPKQCGRDDLVEHCFRLLSKSPPDDYAVDVIDLLTANSSTEELIPMWRSQAHAQKNVQGIEKWLFYGFRMRVLATSGRPDVEPLLIDTPTSYDLFFRAKRFDVLESDITRFNKILRWILEGNATADNRRRAQHVLELIAQTLEARRYASAFHLPASNTLMSAWTSEPRLSIADLLGQEIKTVPDFTEAYKCIEIAGIASHQAERSILDWTTTLEPWDALVESIRERWGENWSCFKLANMAAGIRSQEETGRGYSKLFDESASLCRRARYARLRAGSTTWWQRQWHSADSEQHAMFMILLLTTWGGTSSVRELCKQIGDFLESLDRSQWQTVYRSTRDCLAHLGEAYKARPLRVSELLQATLSTRMSALLMLRANRGGKRLLYDRYLAQYDGNDGVILAICQSMLLMQSGPNRLDWPSILGIASRAYVDGILSEPYAASFFRRRSINISITTEVAIEIASRPNDFPSYLVAAAEEKCQVLVANRVVPVGTIAERDGWTFA